MLKPTLILIANLGLAACLHKEEAQEARQINAANALSHRSETVARTTGRLLWATGTEQQTHELAILRAPFVLLIAGLNAIRADLARELIAPESVVIVGAGGFQPPAGIGPVRSRRLYVIFLSAPSVREAFLRRVRDAGRASGEGGCWTAAIGEFGESNAKATELCAMPVGASELLISNMPDDAREWAAILAGTDALGGRRVTDKQWPSSEFWAIRSTNAGIDVQSDTTQGRRSQVYGVELKVDGHPVRHATFSVDFPTDRSVPGNLSRSGGWPAMREISRGRWQTVIRLGAPDSADQLFRCMSLLGFGVYL